MQDKATKQTDQTPAAGARGRAPLSAIIISSLATTVLIAVIIAGSLYVYHLFPNMRAGSLQEELLGWAVILAGGLACIGVLLLGSKWRQRRGNTPCRGG